MSVEENEKIVRVCLTNQPNTAKWAMADSPSLILLWKTKLETQLSINYQTFFATGPQISFKVQRFLSLLMHASGSRFIMGLLRKLCARFTTLDHKFYKLHHLF